MVDRRDLEKPQKYMARHKDLKFINGKGMVEPYPFIRVDNFYEDGIMYQDGKTQTVFILTHMHADHLGGLTRDWQPVMSWNYGPIYCSEPTYKMMLLRFKHLKQYLRPVPLNEWIYLPKFTYCSAR